jgi:hypothetical protein
MTAKEQAQIVRIMQGLKCSEQEAIEIYQADCAIDRGEKMEFDISKEQEKVVKKMRQADRKPTVYKFDKRERKENATKAGLIQDIFTFLTENCGFEVKNVEITNKERQISFECGEDKFELTLVQKRKLKN